MLTSIALIFLFGIVFGGIFNKLKLPGLLGMIIAGILLGPYVLNLLDDSIFDISAYLMRIALIIILIRVGLSLDINDLKRVGRPAVMMCFVPACFEMAGVIFFAPYILGISSLDAAIMGAVLGAASPAIIVPKMIHLMENRIGTEKSIPQIMMAGTSVDGVFVIIVFTAFIGFGQGEEISASGFIQIPASIIIGAIAGIAIGLLVGFCITKIHMRDSLKVILMLSISFLFISLESIWPVPFSGLIAVIGMAVTLQIKNTEASTRISIKFSKLWIAAEILLFVLVGATVDLNYVFLAGISVIVVIFIALACRLAGVFCCIIKTRLSMKERLFCIIVYIPKATVQAAIGSIPLSIGMSCGNIVLTVAVLAILITAPLGAIGIDTAQKRLLTNENETKSGRMSLSSDA